MRTVSVCRIQWSQEKPRNEELEKTKNYKVRIVISPSPSFLLPSKNSEYLHAECPESEVLQYFKYRRVGQGGGGAKTLGVFKAGGIARKTQKCSNCPLLFLADADRSRTRSGSAPPPPATVCFTRVGSPHCHSSPLRGC